jgi:hypothetical protein
VKKFQPKLPPAIASVADVCVILPGSLPGFTGTGDGYSRRISRVVRR